MNLSKPHSQTMLFLVSVSLLLLSGCSGSLPGATLLTPPALRTEIAAQTAALEGQPLQTAETVMPTGPLAESSASAEAFTATPEQLPTLAPTLELPPTEGPTPTKTVWWRRTPTITPTPQPAPASMLINRPGLFSKVKSPLTISANAMPGADGLVWVELIGEDNRSLYQTRLNFSAYAGRSISIAPEITFEIQAPAELARLVISTRDRLGRIAALTSTDLILIQMGEDQIYPAGYDREPYILRAPEDGQVISGGILQITALVRPVNDNPLIIELLNEQGSVISSTTLDLIFPTGDLSHTPFDVILNYSLAQQTNGRLVFRQESTGRIPGTVALSSVELTLQP